MKSVLQVVRHVNDLINFGNKKGDIESFPSRIRRGLQKRSREAMTVSGN